MMGRLTCMERSETGKKAEDTRFLQPEHGHPTSVYMSPTSNIPLRNHGDIALPPLIPTDPRTHRPVSSFADMPSLEQRAHSFQESNFPASSLAEVKEVRSSAVSPNLKLPPISAKSLSAPETINMPPQNTPEVPVPGPLSNPDGSKTSDLPLMDMRLAYENMMVSYFMPQSVKSENTALPDSHQRDPIASEEIQGCNPDFGRDYGSHPMQMQQIAHCYLPCEAGFIVPLSIAPDGNQRKFQQRPVPLNKALSHRKTTSQNCRITKQTDEPIPVSQHTAMDITSSGCTILDSQTLSDYQQHVNSANTERTNAILKPESDFNTCSLSNIPSNLMQTSSSDQQSSDMAGGDQASNIADMSAVLNELSMFMPTQDNVMAETVFADSNIRTPFISTAATTTTTTTSANTSSGYYQSKTDPAWGRFSVLPPVMASATPLGSCINEGDNLSLMSYNSVPNNAQSTSQMGMYYTSFSPFSVNFSDNLSSALASSPRYSGRSSYSGRGSRNKRALSNSPLSAEGIDLNSIIRMSPTSLIAYINGSRSSSSCVSPGSAGDKTGCYGHLSARNSSSSPHSGSGSSGNRRSTSYTPQTNTPGMSNSRSNQSNITSDNSNMSESCRNNDKGDYINMDDNLFVIQAMQGLESGASNTAFPFNTCVMHPSPMLPECENLQVLPQDIAAFRTEDFMSFIPAVLPPVHTHLQQPFHQTTNQSLLSVGGQHNKPPPTYDQHMARKATLQKNSSSDSSQPSNSSSFESSEGDKTVAGSSSTDTETNRMYACRWLDCIAVFQDQDEFVTHIEKSHIDQKKGDDFVCYWKYCPRRLHPFNARYKLLVHMRVHSGDKPNKCTYAGCKKAFSRLENLKIHLRSHTGERPYACTYPGCVKTFSNSSDRTKHQKTHHDTKPYVCQVVGCGKRYTDPSSLRKHVKKSHPDKKEPDRKKIRGGVEEMDPKDLNECLMVQAIKPITLCDASPPEPTDSGLGKSPRGSQPGSSSDHYPGLVYSGDPVSRSETGQGSSSHTSPSSHHSSPPGQNDRDKLPPNNNSLRVPILPPIVQSPIQQQGFTNQNLNSKARPSSINSARQRAISTSVDSGTVRSTSSLLQETRSVFDTTPSRIPGIYSPCSSSASYKTSTELPLSTMLKPLSRFEGEGS